MKRVVSLLQAAMCLVMWLSVFKWLADIHLVFELATHFVVQYALFSLLAGFVFLITRQYKWTCLAGICLVFNGVQVAPYYVPVSQFEQAEHTLADLSVFHANVLSSNTHYEALLAEIEHKNPDVIFLQEVTPRWITAIDRLRGAYPYVHGVPRHDNFGIAVFSRIPFDTLQTREFHAFVPSIEVTLSQQGQTIRLLSTHPVPPINPSYLISRNAQIKDISVWARDQLDQKIAVIGDLNLTPYSPTFKTLIEAGLTDCRLGKGILPSWPAGYGVTSVLKIPIDHCLSKGLVVQSIQLGNDIGSDHLPLFIRFKMDVEAE